MEVFQEEVPAVAAAALGKKKEAYAFLAYAFIYIKSCVIQSNIKVIEEMIQE